MHRCVLISTLSMQSAFPFTMNPNTTYVGRQVVDDLRPAQRAGAFILILQVEPQVLDSVEPLYRSRRACCLPMDVGATLAQQVPDKVPTDESAAAANRHFLGLQHRSHGLPIP